MSNDALNWAFSQKVTVAQKLVLVVLANRADADWKCWPAVEVIAAEASLSERAVQYNVKKLAAAGLLSIIVQAGKRNVYVLSGGVQDVRGCTTFGGAYGAGVHMTTQRGAYDDMGGAYDDSPTRASSIEPKEEPKENPHSFSASASPDAVHAPAPEPEFYLTKKKRRLAGKRLSAFNRFWAAFAYAKGKADAADSWLDIPELTNSLVETIVTAAEAEAAARPGLVASGHTPKWAQGWLSGRRWEDGAEPSPHEQTLDEYLAERGLAQ